MLRPRRFAVFLLLPTSLLLAASTAAAPAETAGPGAPSPLPATSADTAPAALTGLLLREGTDVPVAGARVLALPAGRLAVTGPDGSFRFPELPPGVVQLRVQSPEGQGAAASLEVPGGATTSVVMTVPPPPIALPDLEVEVPAAAATGRTSGSEARRARAEREGGAGGAFLGRAEIAAAHGRRTADLLDRLPGVRVVPHRTYLGLERVEMGRLAPSLASDCPVRIFVDGMPLPEVERFGYRRLDLDLPAPDEIEGIEAYSGPGRVPPELNAAGARCGVVAIWTRDPKTG